MRKAIFIFIISVLLLHAKCVAQNNTVYGAGISYTNGIPTFVPPSRSARVAIDTVTSKWYEYATPGGWRFAGDRIQRVSGCSAPSYTPTKAQSWIVINGCTEAQNGQGPELYAYDGTAWIFINEKSTAPTYTAGTGISISGDTITNTGDLSNTNELQTLSSGTNTVTLSNGGGTVTVDTDPTNDITTITAGTGISVSGTGDSRTLTNTAPDQIVTISGATGSYPNFTIPSPAVTLNDLTDVTLSTPTNTQVLQYNTATTQWVNATLAAITGSGTANYIPKFSSSTNLSDSQIQDNVNVSVNGAVDVNYKFSVYSSTGSVMRFRNTTSSTFSDFFVGAVAFTIGSNSQLSVSHTAPANAFSVEANRIVTSLTELRSSTDNLFIRPTTGGVSGKYISIDGFNGGWVTAFRVANTGSGGSAIIAQITPSGGIAAIGTASPSSASKLDVTSTTGGILFPRMTATQRDAIAAPPDGLVVYNTTANKLQVRAASSWVDLH